MNPLELMMDKHGLGKNGRHNKQCGSSVHGLHLSSNMELAWEGGKCGEMWRVNLSFGRFYGDDVGAADAAGIVGGYGGSGGGKCNLKRLPKNPNPETEGILVRVWILRGLNLVIK